MNSLIRISSNQNAEINKAMYQTTPVSVSEIVAMVGSVSFLCLLPFGELKKKILRRISLAELAFIFFLNEIIDYPQFNIADYTGSLVLYI